MFVFIFLNNHFLGFCCDFKWLVEMCWATNFCGFVVISSGLLKCVEQPIFVVLLRFPGDWTTKSMGTFKSMEFKGWLKPALNSSGGRTPGRRLGHVWPRDWPRDDPSDERDWCVLRRVAGWVAGWVAGMMTLLVMKWIIPENSLLGASKMIIW